MKSYIGVKMLRAEPREREGRSGYRVVYQDGYESWSPKEVFEKAYMELSHNPELKDSDAPSISEKMVLDFITDWDTMTWGDRTTVVKVTLRNGFILVDSSSCVSAANYDEAMGASICRERIVNRVWTLLGFLLQSAVSGIGLKKENE